MPPLEIYEPNYVAAANTSSEIDGEQNSVASANSSSELYQELNHRAASTSSELYDEPNSVPASTISISHRIYSCDPPRMYVPC